MSNPASRQAKPTKKGQRLARNSRKNRVRGWLWGSLLAICTLVGGPAAIVSFLPRVSVTPSDPVYPGDPLSSSFTIANENFIPLKHVMVDLALGRIGYGALNSNVVPTLGARLRWLPWQDHTLYMDDKFTVTPSDSIKSESGEADIAIIISYQPWIIPWRREKVFRFKTHKDDVGGGFHWFHTPLPNE
jgi:hypothetical protein